MSSVINEKSPSFSGRMMEMILRQKISKDQLFLLKVAILVYAVFLFMSKPFVSVADFDDLQRFLTRTECFCQEKLVAKKRTLCYTVLKIIAKVGII